MRGWLGAAQLAVVNGEEIMSIASATDTSKSYMHSLNALRHTDLSLLEHQTNRKGMHEERHLPCDFADFGLQQGGREEEYAS